MPKEGSSIERKLTDGFFVVLQYYEHAKILIGNEQGMKNTRLQIRLPNLKNPSTPSEAIYELRTFDKPTGKKGPNIAWILENGTIFKKDSQEYEDYMSKHK